MAKECVYTLSPDVKVYRNPKTGIAWVEDGSTGMCFSCHPNIDKTGSVTGMKKCGYWGAKDKTVRSNGYIYNISLMAMSDPLDKVAASYCRCDTCIERLHSV